MECPRCQTVAPEGAKFCMSCGSPMSAICPECGTELPAEARFCLNCGNQLPQAASQSASGSNQESPGAAGLEQYILKKLLAKLEAARGSGGLQGENGGWSPCCSATSPAPPPPRKNWTRKSGPR